MNKKLKIFVICLLFLTVGWFLVPQLVNAQASLGLEVGAETGLGTRDIKETAVLVVNIILGFLGIISVIVLLYGGYVWLTAAGNEEKVATAKKVLVNAIIGLVVILASYAIVTYVVNIFSEATDSSGINQNINQEDPSAPGGSLSKLFYMVSGTPVSPPPLNIRNVIPQATFNNSLSAEALSSPSDYFRVVMAQDPNNQPISGSFEFRNNNSRVAFIPENLCPEPNDTLRCFEADKEYKMEIYNQNLQDIDGRTISCDKYECSFSFITGSLVDTAPPEAELKESQVQTIILPLENGAELPLDTVNTLFSQAKDDSGIGLVDYYLDGEVEGTGMLVQLSQEAPYTFEANYDWDTTGLEVNQNYYLSVKATDYADNSNFSADVRIIFRPAFCFNNQFDPQEGETGVDCGGFCGACDGKLCGQLDEDNVCSNTDGAICASGVCDAETCLCVSPPTINSVEDDNGAPGNWVTIYGSGFGQDPGIVTFNGTEADLPIADICPVVWDNYQIIAIVPNIEIGLADVRIETADGLFSDVYDEFLINDVVRPGICSVEPATGLINTEFTITGVQFGQADAERKVYFGRPDNGITAQTPYNWQDLNDRSLVSASVPNLKAGLTGVRININGQDSNPLFFTVEADLNNEPVISYFSPETGTDGQYITIYGSGFGDYVPGASRVIFSTDKEGDFAFPDGCGTDFWTDNKIIVKVPSTEEVGVLDSLGPIRLITASGLTAVSSDNFNYNQDLPVTPGVCSIFPDNGLPGSVFDIAGDNFTNSQIDFNGILLADQPASDQLFSEVTIPEAAASGPVRLVREGQYSNPIDFEVLAGETSENEIPFDYYQWQFTTCYDCLVPEVVESGSCTSNLASPTPLKNSQENFVNSVISATFNTIMTHEDFVLGESVSLLNCGNGDNPANCLEEDVLGSFNFGMAGSNHEFFQLSLDSNLAAANWYQVVLSGLTSSSSFDGSAVEHVAIEEPYSWYFKTRNSNEQCVFTDVNLNPAERLAGGLPPDNNNPLYIGDSVWYRGSVYNGETCNVCPDNFSWQWSSSNQSVAQIDETSEISSSLLNALDITENTETIIAQVTDELGNVGQATALLDIVPSDPQLVINNSCNNNQSPSPFINSTDVCLNAKIAGQFNMAMDPATLSLDNISFTYSCNGGQVCDISGQLEIVKNKSGQTDGFIFTPDENLPANQRVNVSLSDNILSADGANLTGIMNWGFNVRNSTAECLFDSVYVYPSSSLLGLDESQVYQAEAYDSNSCSVLKTVTNSWDWYSTNNNVAFISDLPEDNSLSQATVTSLAEGLTYIRAEAANGIRNLNENGRLEVSASGLPASLQLVSTAPSGSDICVNSSGRAEFNLGLNESTINGDNFTVYKIVDGNSERYSYCSNDPNLNCQTDDDCPGIPEGFCQDYWKTRGSLNNTVISILPDNLEAVWDAGSRFEIMVQGGSQGIISYNGRPLDAEGCLGNWNEETRQCSWSFITSQELCQVDHIQIFPDSISTTVGLQSDWLAEPYGQDDNVLSNSIDYWASSTVWATREPVGSIETTSQDGREAQSQALNAGQMTVYAGTPRTVGGNIVWDSANFEAAEVLSGPSLESVQPTGDTVCTNALIKLEFDKPLDPDSLTSEALKIGWVSDVDEGNCEFINDGLNTQGSSKEAPLKLNLIKSYLARLFNWLTGDIVSSIINTVQAQELDEPYYLCPIAGGWSMENIFNSGEIQFILSDLLPSNQEIRILVNSGENTLRSTEGMVLEESYSHSFTTRQAACQLSSVNVTADQNQTSWTFYTSNDSTITGDNDFNDPLYDSINDRDKNYSASAISLDGMQIMPVEGVYSWDWQWDTGDNSIATIEAIEADRALVAAANNNGQTDVVATAVFNNPDNNLSGSGQANVFLCENPWPASISTNIDRYVDNTFHFGLYYCRDYGYEGAQDDLPALNRNDFIIESHTVNGTDNKDELLKEYLIPVPATGDFIGLRVYENSFHLSPLEWYRKNINFQGQPTSLTIDGYNAIKDGRTVYVAGSNVGNYDCAQTAGSDNNFGFASSGANTNGSLKGSGSSDDTQEFNPSDSSLDGQTLDSSESNNGTNSGNTYLEGSSNSNANLPTSFNQIFKTIGSFAKNILSQPITSVLAADLFEFIGSDPGDGQIIVPQDPPINENLDCLAYDIDNPYTNIYLISYNQEADPETEEIVSQLIDNFRLNTNVVHSNVKEKITRDVKRLADLNSLASYLDNYQGQNFGEYPALDAGTYLRGMSTSKWPSWSQTLGSELGRTLPSDPINLFGSCINCQEVNVLNDSFEFGFTSWNLSNPDGLNVLTDINNDATYIRDGLNSLHLTASGAPGGISQEVNLQENVSYDISAWVYIVSGQVQLTFIGDDSGNEWISPADHSGWFQLKNRIITNDGLGVGPNNPENFIYIRSHEGPAEFYVDLVNLETTGGNCGYDTQTCWNPDVNDGSGSFACDADSYFYRYQAAVDTQGLASNYLLASKFEATIDWLPANNDNYNFIDPHINLSTINVLGCSQENFVGYCGDGIVGEGEECEGGMSYYLCSPAYDWYNQSGLGPHGCFAPPAENQCTWYNPLTDNQHECFGLYSDEHCCGGYCGDGVLNTAANGYNVSVDEACELNVGGYGDGTSNINQYSCSTNCTDIGGWCGDGTYQSAYEGCDNSVIFGTSGFGSGTSNINQYSCSTNCTDIGGWCGDGIIQRDFENCDPNILAPHTECLNICQVYSCQTGYEACDGNMSDNDGCEINLLTDNNNCGACGLGCSANQNCENGVCVNLHVDIRS